MKEKATPAAGETRDVAVADPPAAAGNPALAAAVNCPACGQPSLPPGAPASSAAATQPVYAVGRLSPQFPSIGVEKEFAQLTAGAHQGDRVEVELLQQVLGSPENAYLARHLCWIFASAGVDTFTVLPRDDAEVARLVEVLSPAEPEEVVHVVVGRTAASSVDSPCAAAGLPTVRADQVLAFTPREFAAAMPDETSSGEEPAAAGSTADYRAGFEAAVRGVFARLTRGAGNRGLSDEHRARNYVALRYPPIYHAVWQAQRDGKVLVGLDARHSHSADRRLVAVRLTVRHPRTDITERHQCLVDVTEVFPFLITGLQPVYD